MIVVYFGLTSLVKFYVIVNLERRLGILTTEDAAIGRGLWAGRMWIGFWQKVGSDPILRWLLNAVTVLFLVTVVTLDLYLLVP